MQPHKIIRSSRKTIALQINENAELIVRAPFHVSQRRINQFIEEKKDWIAKTHKKALYRKKISEENSEIRDGKRALFLGKEYEIRLNGKIKSIEVDENVMQFPFSKIDNAEYYLAMWYKKKAKKIIIPRTEKYAEAIGVSFSKIAITSAKKRWGSCNSKGNINFSYRLVMTPPEVIDYVIVHELMHLKELNHSAKFWARVETVIPDYKQRRKWLKENQHRFDI